jgi:hypothetical protein
MKKFIHYILFYCFSLLSAVQVSAQCEPDTSCVDVNNAGAFCPEVLPDMILNEPYEAVITIIPPSEYELEGTLLTIPYIEIDSVLNFPPGITYSINAKRFYADSAYCVLISGTPTQTGVFALQLYITPYISLPPLGNIKGPQTIDKTSVVLTVQDVTSTELPHTNQFEVLQNAPNPFSQSTRIGFYTPIPDNINLKVYSYLGELIYEESRQVVPGEHYFRFDGRGLLAGSYLYLVTSGTSHQTRKLVKTR